MCKDCKKRKRSYDWVRDGDGKPKRTPNGSYMMVDEMGAYYGFTIESIAIAKKLFEELVWHVGSETDLD